jgi:hypothetical protein
MTSIDVFRLYFAVRRQHLGIVRAAVLAFKEAIRPTKF